MAKEELVKGDGTRPVEVGGQVKQVRIFKKTVTTVIEVDKESLKKQRAELVAKIADIDAQIAEITAAGE